eukprot:CAMPEP_0115848562 /NCGR_PEP_ID=MMETSP0287-20121206/10988_1 /TAXON_ID=412157 /ORGANISM="Chrysochromulina rotalis, Strain UIO044" /LENGTH=202 /DNA_ID=CAMNT_0003302483 /DNA_START=48 /DNA_END=656 /DNA_ORIENTATION=-
MASATALGDGGADGDGWTSPVMRRVCPPGQPGPILFNRRADKRKRAEQAAAAEVAATAATAAARAAEKSAKTIRPAGEVLGSPASRQPPELAPLLRSTSLRELLPLTSGPAEGAARARAAEKRPMAPPPKVVPTSKHVDAAAIAAKALEEERRDVAARARARSSKAATKNALAQLYASSSEQMDSSQEQEQSPYPRARKRKG